MYALVNLPADPRNYIYRNTQLYTQIVYCTLWEECKQIQCPPRSWSKGTKALMWYYSPTKNKLIYQVKANTYDFWLSGQFGKYNIITFLFHPFWALSLKNDALPLNSLFWSLPTAVHRFDAQDMAVPADFLLGTSFIKTIIKIGNKGGNCCWNWPGLFTINQFLSSSNTK